MRSQLLLLAALTPAALASIQNLCDQYSYYSANGWYINNNEWNAAAGTGSQCTYLDSINTGGISWHTDWTWSGGDTSVKSYPYSGRDLSSNKQKLTDIATINSVAQWSYTGSNLRCNIAFDTFTSSDPNHAITSGDYEVMVWIGRYGGVQPLGTTQGTVTVGGRSWELFSGTRNGMKVFSFVAPSPITSWSSDIRPFYTYLTDHQGFPASSQYLLTLQFGSEPFTGDSARFTVGHWDGTVI